MPIDNARLAPMRPGVSLDELKAALGTSWKEPSLQAEGHLHIEEFGTRIAADGRLGEVHFRAPSNFPLSMASGWECRPKSCIGFIPVSSASRTRGRNMAGPC
ncbi:DUF7256 domain-containing protein [Rhizobium leguminosarum]|uniref:DUF7256 domain-containing protein n=1 Tax=Rhizobium leguminosarum TaxID=384 RepID=UPI003FA061E2